MRTLLKNILFYSFILLIIFFDKNYKTNKEKEIVENSINTYGITYNEDECKNILIIPKINLYKCMNINDVNKDISVLYDDKTVVLAAHSGTGYLAFFKDLYKLTTNDNVIFYHNGKRKIYSVVSKSHKLKKDKLHFENKEKQLILITCSYTNKKEQIIYYLLEK